MEAAVRHAAVLRQACAASKHLAKGEMFLAMKGARTRMRVYTYVKEYIERYGYSPTVREICLGADLRSPSSAFGHLKKLDEEGLLVVVSGKKRSISLPYQAGATVHVPLVGTVTAGNPILAVETHEGHVPAARTLVRERAVFALRVKGDSMIGAAILDGDIVLVEHTPTAENGEIVVALLDDEATVKRFYRENGGYRLQAENPQFPPILTDELIVIGRVVGLYREL